MTVVRDSDNPEICCRVTGQGPWFWSCTVHVCTYVCIRVRVGGGMGIARKCWTWIYCPLVSHGTARSPGRVPPPPASASSAEKEAGGRTPEACPPPGKLACGAVPEAPGLLPRQLRCQRLCFLLVPSVWEAGRTPPRVCGKPDARCVHRSPPPPSSAAFSAETALCPGARPLPSPPPPSFMRRFTGSKLGSYNFLFLIPI